MTKLVVLGLSLSSSWGNGHATTYRALLRAAAGLGLEIVFLERDVPWYASHRDLPDPPYCRLVLYDGLRDLRRHEALLSSADAVMVGSYVPDGIAVGDLVCDVARGLRLFYDIDTPVTLAALTDGTCTYLASRQISRYDAYLSFTGGPTLLRLENELGAGIARPLYCSVDPTDYHPLDVPRRWELGFLGTYSPDRQAGLERLLIEPARRMPSSRFVVVGAQFPSTIDWPPNVDRLDHLPPSRHSWLYSSCKWTLNLTRAAMIEAGYSPSVRLFEAAACGTPIISDFWEGFDTVLAPGTEAVIATGTEDVLAALALPARRRAQVATAARRHVLAEHSAIHRARQLVACIEEAAAGRDEALGPDAARSPGGGRRKELTLQRPS